MDRLQDVYDDNSSGGGMSEKTFGKLLGQRDKWYVNRWFNVFNTSKSGSLSFEEFSTGLSTVIGKDSMAKAQMMLEVFDEDNDGVLNESEVHSALDHTIGMADSMAG